MAIQFYTRTRYTHKTKRRAFLPLTFCKGISLEDENRKMKGKDLYLGLLAGKTKRNEKRVRMILGKLLEIDCRLIGNKNKERNRNLFQKVQGEPGVRRQSVDGIVFLFPQQQVTPYSFKRSPST